MNQREVPGQIDDKQEAGKDYCQEMRLFRKEEVRKMTGLPTSTMYAYIKRGAFPRQVKIGPRSSAWRMEEVKQWVRDRQPSQKF